MKRRRRIRAAGLILLGACAPDLPTGHEPPAGVRFLELTGRWHYTASDIRRAGAMEDPPCRIEGVVLELEKIRGAGAFTGTSSGGTLSCPGDLAVLDGPLVPYQIGTGYTFNANVSFDFGSPDWRHLGNVMSADSMVVDSMRGRFNLRNAGVLYDGTFRLVRVR